MLFVRKILFAYSQATINGGPCSRGISNTIFKYTKLSYKPANTEIVLRSDINVTIVIE